MNCCPVSNCGVAPIIVLIFVGLALFVSLIVTIVLIWLYCRIFSKAGYCWALGLLMLIPIVNIVMLCILGIGDWPVLKELRQLKQQAGTAKP